MMWLIVEIDVHCSGRDSYQSYSSSGTVIPIWAYQRATAISGSPLQPLFYSQLHAMNLTLVLNSSIRSCWLTLNISPTHPSSILVCRQHMYVVCSVTASVHLNHITFHVIYSLVLFCIGEVVGQASLTGSPTISVVRACLVQVSTSVNGAFCVMITLMLCWLALYSLASVLWLDAEAWQLCWPFVSASMHRGDLNFTFGHHNA